MDACLLTYQFSTTPIPLQVTAAGSQATSRINLAVFNPTPGVLCSQIMVAVPVGTGATDFCVQPPTASVNTGKWTIASQRIVSGADIGELPGSYAAITFQCRDQADYAIGYSLVLSLVGVVNSTVGSFRYALQEMSGTSPGDLTPKASDHTLSKQDAIITLGNFVATAVSSPTIPGTRFANGQPIRLSWESNGTWFQVYAKGSASPVYAGPATSFTPLGGVATDTQFILVGSVTGNPGQDSPSPGYQAIYLYDALTLVVSNPDLTPRTVTAEGDVSTPNAVSAGKLVVTGDATVSGPLTAYGATTVTGSSEFTAPMTVRADLTSTGAVSAGRLSAQSVSAPVVSAGTLQSAGGGSPLIRDDNGHTWLIKWMAQTGNELVAQLFMWDNSQRWGGLRLPILGYKTFVIDHPLDPDRYLVHATLEGPEAAVFYRGTARLAEGRAEIRLPDYADALTDPDSWTVQLSNVGGFDRLALADLDGRCVRKGRFVVLAQDPSSTQAFQWEAKGTRRDQGALDPEPPCRGLDVHSVGPYTFLAGDTAAVDQDHGTVSWSSGVDEGAG
jgi:hypothetical protein